MKIFTQVELNYCYHRDGLRLGSIADANDEKHLGELTTRAWAKGVQTSN